MYPDVQAHTKYYGLIFTNLLYCSRNVSLIGDFPPLLLGTMWATVVHYLKKELAILVVTM